MNSLRPEEEIGRINKAKYKFKFSKLQSSSFIRHERPRAAKFHSRLPPSQYFILAQLGKKLSYCQQDAIIGHLKTRDRSRDLKKKMASIVWLYKLTIKEVEE